MRLERSGERRYQTKQELVYQTLRDAIMRCQLTPGSRLVIEEIAQQIKVSHIPVREALQLLQSERLVVMVPHIGATVAPLPVESLSETLMLLEGLELVAVRAAAGPSELLTTLLAELDGALGRADVRAWADLSVAFQRSLAASSGLPMLTELIDRVLNHWARMQCYFFAAMPACDLVPLQRSYHGLLDALGDADVARRECAIRSHYQIATQVYSSYLAPAERTVT